MTSSRETPAALLAAAGALYAWCLPWGLPSEARSRPYFPSPTENAVLFRRLSATWRPPDGTILEHNRSADAAVVAAGGDPLLFPAGRLSETPHALALLRNLRVAPPHYGESHALAALAAMRPREGDFDPHTVVYGGFYLYALAGLLKAASLTGLVVLSPDISTYVSAPEEMGRLLLLARALSAVGALAGIVLAFRLAAALGGRFAGLVAAGLVAASPALWSDAHTVAPHAFGLPFFLFSLLESTKSLRGGGPARLWWAAAWAALAAGGAVYYATALLPPLALARRRPWTAAGLLALAGVIFLATNPYVALRWDRAWTEYSAWIFREKGNPFPNGSGIGNLAWCLAYIIPTSAGFPATPVLIAGAARLLRSGPARTVLGLPALGGLLYIGFTVPWGVEHHQGRQMLGVTVPLLAAGAGRLLAPGGRGNRARTTLAALCGTGAALTAGLYAAFHVAGAGADGPAARAGRWIAANVPAGARVGLNQTPHPFLAPRFDIRAYTLRIARTNAEYDRMRPLPDWFVRMRHADGLDARLARDFAPAAFFGPPRWMRRAGLSPAFLPTQCDFAILRRRP